LSYVQVEAAYTNPVMNVFVHLLMAQAEGKFTRGNFKLFCEAIHCPSMCYPIVAAYPGQHYGATPLLEANELVEVNDMARRRWHLAYTLLRNPQLIELRRGQSTEYRQTSAGGSSVNSKNVDLKLTSGISLTEDYQV